MAKRVRKKPRYQVEEETKARTKAAKVEELSRTLGTRMPDGRIVADLSQRFPHDSSFEHAPVYYEDREFLCRDCGKSQVWTAEQQKWWYEVANGPLHSAAIRCRECRVALREAHGGTPRRSQRDRFRAGEA